MGDSGRLSNYRWAILLVSGMVIFTIDFMQFQLSALAYEVMPALGIDVAQFSALLFAPMLAGAACSVPAGSLADRYGSKAVVTAALAVSVLAGFGRLAAGDFATLFVMMFGLGIAGAAVQSVCVKLYGLWFEDGVGFAMGVFFALSCAGLALGLATASLFPNVDAAYLFSSFMLLIVLVAWVAFARNAPKNVRVAPPDPVMSHLLAALKSRSVWLIAISCGLGLATATAYSGLLPQALVEVRGVDPATAGNMVAVLRILSIAGSMLGPVLCRRHVRRALVALSVLGGTVMVANWFAEPGSSLFWALVVVNAIVTVAPGPVLEALPFSLSEIGAEHAASAGGVVCSISLVVSYIIPVAVGAIVGSDYTLNFVLMGVFYALAAVPVLLLPKTVDGTLAKHAID